jgi:hypothetical protein
MPINNGKTRLVQTATTNKGVRGFRKVLRFAGLLLALGCFLIAVPVILGFVTFYDTTVARNVILGIIIGILLARHA